MKPEDDDPESCSLKGCQNPGTYLPVITVACKGKKGRGKNVKRMTSTLPAPMCEDHIHLATARDFFKYIDWNALHVKFNQEGLPAPKRSTARLSWVKAKQVT